MQINIWTMILAPGSKHRYPCTQSAEGVQQQFVTLIQFHYWSAHLASIFSLDVKVMVKPFIITLLKMSKKKQVTVLLYFSTNSYHLTCKVFPVVLTSAQLWSTAICCRHLSSTSFQQLSCVGFRTVDTDTAEGSGFFLACQDFGTMFDHSFPACTFFVCFEMEISSCTPVPLFMPESVHSGSVS